MGQPAGTTDRPLRRTINADHRITVRPDAEPRRGIARAGATIERVASRSGAVITEPYITWPSPPLSRRRSVLPLRGSSPSSSRRRSARAVRESNRGPLECLPACLCGCHSADATLGGDDRASGCHTRVGLTSRRRTHRGR